MNTLNKISIHIKYLFILSIALFAFACVEEIDIDLNNSNPVLTTEGQLVLDSTAWIQLNYTMDYFDPAAPESIKDAIVIITDSKGNSETLQHIDSGFYQGSELRGQINEEYSISINNNEINVNAKTQLKAPTEIIKVEYEEVVSHYQDPEDTNKYYELTIDFKDDSTTTNYYLLKYFAQEEEDLGTDLMADLNYFYTLIENTYYASNGIISYSQPFQYYIGTGRVLVIIYSIDMDTYTYYNQLNNSKGGGGSTPYNPKSNFGDEVMGYFTAWSYDTYEGIAGE